MDCDVPKLKMKQTAPCINEDSASKLLSKALRRMSRDVLQLKVKHVTPCVDEDSAADYRLDARVRKEHDHADTVFEKTFLHTDENATSMPLNYRYIKISFERNHRHKTMHV